MTRIIQNGFNKDGSLYNFFTQIYDNYHRDRKKQREK